MDKQLRVALSLTVLLGAASGILAIRLHSSISYRSSHEALAADQAALEKSATVPVNPQPTDRKPEEYYGSFFYRTASEMLKALNVTVYPEDRVYSFPDPALGMGSEIKVYRAQPVLIKDAGSEYLVRTWSSTVGAILDEQRVELGEKDLVTPAAAAPIAPGQATSVIAITRVSESRLKVKEAIVFGVEYVNDPDLIIGLTKVVKEGETGTKEKTYTVRRENGMEVSRTLLSTNMIKDPVNKVIAKGTKPNRVYLSSGQYKAYFNEAADKYNVPADKIQSLMYCESGGNVNSLGSGGTYKGLFQFDDTTWSRTAYASYSIYDPWAQVMAAASLWQWRSAKWPLCVSRLGL